MGCVWGCPSGGGSLFYLNIIYSSFVSAKCELCEFSASLLSSSGVADVRDNAWMVPFPL